MTEHLFTYSIGVLLVGGAVAYLLEKAYRRATGFVAVACSFASLLAAVALMQGGPEVVRLSAFQLPAPLEIDLAFRITPFLSVINVLAMLFGFCVMLYSTSYFSGRSGSGRFHAFGLWAVAGASVALMTSNLLVFILAWEMVTLMLYLLVCAGGPKARQGAAKTFAVLGFSDCAIILGIACLVARGGLPALGMAHLEGAGHITVTTWADVGIFLLFLVGALAKAGAVPVHTWIPAAAEHAPMPTMALLPASLDKLLGIVLLARISLGFFTLTDGLKILLMCIGAVTIIAAVMMAMVQHELKKLLSFHAVSQVGYMVLGIGTGVPIGVIGGLFHMVNNAIYKSLLFLSGGAVEHRTGGLELDKLGGLSKAMPLTFMAFFIGALAISGVPPLNGFVSKWLVYQGVLEAGGTLMPVLLAAAVLGSALTLASFIKAIHAVFLGEASDELAGKKLTEAPASMLAPMAILAALCVALGVGAGLVVRNFLLPGVAELGLKEGLELESVSGLASATGLWGPMPAVVLIGAGLVLGLLFYVIGKGLKIRRVRPFIGGEVTTPAPTQMSGTGFYKTVRELPMLRQMYSDAEAGAFDPYRWVGQYGQKLTGWLSTLHTGILETYATWIIAGTAAALALLFLWKK